MAFYDRVKFSTATTGTGAITVGSASTGARTPAGASVPDGDALGILIEDGAAWELSAAIYTASGATLTRTLIASSTGSLLSLSGSAVVSITALATDLSASAMFTVNFVAPADAYIPARQAMRIAQGNSPIGTGTIVYAKSTAAAPATFTTTTLPATLEAGAWLRVTASAITGFVALDLYRAI